MFKKKLLIIFFIFFSNYCYALSNQEVRQAIQDWINSQEYPQEMDELTMMIDTVTTSRGILYTYQLNLHQDDLIDFRPVFNSIKSTALEVLCNNPASSEDFMSIVDLVDFDYLESNLYVDPGSDLFLI